VPYVASRAHSIRVQQFSHAASPRRSPQQLIGRGEELQIGPSPSLTPASLSFSGVEFGALAPVLCTIVDIPRTAPCTWTYSSAGVRSIQAGMNPMHHRCAARLSISTGPRQSRTLFDSESPWGRSALWSDGYGRARLFEDATAPLASNAERSRGHVGFTGPCSVACGIAGASALAVIPTSSLLRAVAARPPTVCTAFISGECPIQYINGRHLYAPDGPCPFMDRHGDLAALQNSGKAPT
jgi:hypothetical protein